MNALRILDEASFRQTLFLERKRSERTAATFLLAFLDLDLELIVHGRKKTGIDQIGVTLAATFRDTDVVGWCKHNSTIGIIFTALNGTSRTDITEAVSSRIREALSRILEP